MTARPRRHGGRRRGRLAALAAGAALVVAVACADLGTGVGEISYIDFDGIPYPALIAGDTMRDSLGVAAPLRARAFDASGREIVDAPFQYILLDTGAALDANGVLRATTRRDGLVRIVASLGGLQTGDRSVRVTRRPDAVSPATPLSLALGYVIPDVAATNLAAEMRIRLVTADSLDVGPNVGGWLVRWRAVHGTDTLAITDTTLVALQTATGARRAIDTTSAEGTSSRRLRVFANRLTTATDSFVVLADVRLHGAPVAGSPIRFVVHIAPVAP